MNIVIDTNVLISGIFWRGTPRRFLSLVFRQGVKPFATIDMMAEYCRIIDKIANKHTDVAAKWKSQIAKVMTVIEKTETIDACRDPKDNMFLECAVAANAYYLVSGDSDLLVLGKIKDIPIITVNQFFDAHPEFGVGEM
ncbi:putative toxin-antitoxin system toxin component, PIN family [uncultured Fibrobacter sp.]|uniref:putative toxin-antitoxin system toxin component, PIN family n=1 Tax=uncultured Fibrobacter sp. TaxID=261512 RepID=UPI002804B378|nr:putative toxin-antitoxin system toxin component, PIN family [uncultured Fibrobacter sp.]